MHIQAILSMGEIINWSGINKKKLEMNEVNVVTELKQFYESK